MVFGVIEGGRKLPKDLFREPRRMRKKRETKKLLDEAREELQLIQFANDVQGYVNTNDADQLIATCEKLIKFIEEEL